MTVAALSRSSSSPHHTQLKSMHLGHGTRQDRRRTKIRGPVVAAINMSVTVIRLRLRFCPVLMAAQPTFFLEK